MLLLTQKPDLFLEFLKTLENLGAPEEITDLFKSTKLKDLKKLSPDLKFASEISRPEDALLRDEFKAFTAKLKNYDNLDSTSYPSKTYVRDELKKIPVTPKINKIKDIDIPTSTILKGLGKGTLRAVAPFVPFVGAVGVALGVSDVAKAKDQGLEGEELGIAYFLGPELAKKYSDYKDRNLDVESVEEEGIMGLKDGGRVRFQGGGRDASESDFDTPDTPDSPGDSDTGGSSNREVGIMSRGLGPKGTTGNIGDFSPTGPDDRSTPEQTARNRLAIDIARGLYTVNRPNIVTTAMRNPLFRVGLYAINPFDLGRKAINVYDVVTGAYDDIVNPELGDVAE